MEVLRLRLAKLRQHARRPVGRRRRVHLARRDLRLALGRHVGAEYLAVRALAPPVARLDHELRREDVGQLGAVAIAAAGYLTITGPHQATAEDQVASRRQQLGGEEHLLNA